MSAQPATTVFVPKRDDAELLPPEGVPIRFRMASLGARFGAQMLDLTITWGGAAVFLVLIAWIGLLQWEAFFTLLVLLMFLLRVPYYILAEIVWNGQTLGKKIVGLRVISGNGRRLTAYQVTARNLMKEVEFFTPFAMVFGSAFGALDVPGSIVMLIWVLVVAVVPFRSKRKQRLGDMIAGTIVVEQPKVVLLTDLALQAGAAAQAERFAFMPVHLDKYGRYELQTLEEILRDAPKLKTGHEEIRKVAEAILKKIGYAEPVRLDEYSDFLFAFYRAQREHLESRRLFGDRRENKFHADETGGDAKGAQGNPPH